MSRFIFIAKDIWRELTVLGKCTVGIPIIIFAYCAIVVVAIPIIIVYFLVKYGELLENKYPKTWGRRLFKGGLFLK